MNVLPVIVRELRAGARQPLNYWSRVLGAGVVIVVFTVMMLGHQGSPATLGAKLFTSLHTAIFVSIWVFVPAMTADCIAREKREGTLGLLFLTPLTPTEIVVGKSFVQMLRALTLWLSALPVMAIPLLLGGVTGLDIYTAFTFEFCAVLLALSAGLLASSLSKVWGRAVLTAELLSLLLAVLFGGFLVLTWAFQIIPLLPGFPWRPNPWGEILSFDRFMSGSIFLSTGSAETNWSRFVANMPPGTGQVWVMEVGETLLFCVLIFWLTVRYCARQVQQSWQDAPLSPRKLWWFKKLTTPLILRAQSRRHLRRLLDRNPIAWLHQFSWSARLTKWGWCFGFIAVECVAAALWVSRSDTMSLLDAQVWLVLALVLGLTFVASGSFMKEKENGVLELLLVSPLPLRQLIFGRVVGMWRQFLPAALVIVVASLVINSWPGSGHSSQNLALKRWFAVQTLTFSRARPGTVIAPIPWVLLNPPHPFAVTGPVSVVAFATLPFIGLYFSLRLKRLLVAWLLTWIMGGLLPLAFGYSLVGLIHGYNSPGFDAIMICLCQIAFASLACFLLRHSLSRRIYPFA